MCVHVGTGDYGCQKLSELELKVVESWPTWVLGSQPMALSRCSVYAWPLCHCFLNWMVGGWGGRVWLSKMCVALIWFNEWQTGLCFDLSLSLPHLCCPPGHRSLLSHYFCLSFLVWCWLWFYSDLIWKRNWKPKISTFCPPNWWRYWGLFSSVLQKQT